MQPARERGRAGCLGYGERLCKSSFYGMPGATNYMLCQRSSSSAQAANQWRILHLGTTRTHTLSQKTASLNFQRLCFNINTPGDCYYVLSASLQNVSQQIRSLH
jgi:hypothetical protein